MVIDNGVMISIAIELLKTYIDKLHADCFLIVSSPCVVLTTLIAPQRQRLKSLMKLVPCIHIPSVSWISYLSLFHFPTGFAKFLNGGFRWEIIKKPLNRRTNVRLVPQPSFWLSELKNILKEIGKNKQDISQLRMGRCSKKR